MAERDDIIEVDEDDDKAAAGLPSEDTEDGGTIVDTGDGQPSVYDASGDHFDNLVSRFPSTALNRLGIDYLDMADRFRTAREERDKQYAEGIKRTGLGQEAPGGADFQGASRAVHPMITEACVDFAARAIKELMPPGQGPVKDYVVGKQTVQKLGKAKRKTEFMNWQLTRQMTGFRTVLYQLLTQLGMGGSQYMLMGWEHRRHAPCPAFVPIDLIILPPSAASWDAAQFKGYIDNVTQAEFEDRLDAGEYELDDLVAPSSLPDQTKAQKATDKIEGKDQDPYNTEGLRPIYNFFVMEDFSEYLLDEEERKGTPRATLPYLVNVDFHTRKVIGIYRNWRPDTDTVEEIPWVSEWCFIPWRGAFGIGFPHLIGGLSAAATGALRALLDSGHVNNIPAGIKLPGGTSGGASVIVRPGEIQTVDAQVGVDDIRKLAMPFPLNPPSDALFKLLGFVVDAGKGVVRTTLEETADSNSNVPVGTTLARYEQGMVVYSAIMGTLHDSFNRLLRTLHTINAIYLDDKQVIDELGELVVKRTDFEGPCDVIPVSDPNVYSDAQRINQAQIVVARADAHPERYDGQLVEEYLLDRLKIQGGKELLVKKPEPQRLNAVNENTAAMMGKPLSAFPDQDQLAHIQAHTEFMTSPVFGMLPIAAPAVLPVMLSHLKEHIAFLYLQLVFSEASTAAGQDISKLMPDADDDKGGADGREFDQMLAAASGLAIDQAQAALKGVIPAIEQAMQMMQQLQPPGMGADPTAQATLELLKQRTQAQQQAAEEKKQSNVIRMQDSQQKAEAQKRKEALDAARLQADNEHRDAQLQAQERQRQQQALTAQGHEQAEDRRAAADNAARIAINTQDNETALTIASAEIASGEKVALSTGTGINPSKEK